jgi:hypothetical protein
MNNKIILKRSRKKKRISENIYGLSDDSLKSLKVKASRALTSDHT